MFHFFTKKEFLIDHLAGFVDIHNHILPGIDDGAKTVTDSLELIKGFGEFGVKNFICTPHIMHNYYENTPETIKKSYDELQNALKKQNSNDVRIAYAAEHMIDDNFEAILEEEMVMPLKKQYLLIEMSYLQASINFDAALQKIAANRYFPILAHPERYLFLHAKKKQYHIYRENGVLFQLNLLSLGDFYGKDVQQMANWLLENGFIDLLGTDVHNLIQLKKLKEVRLTNKILDLIMPIIENNLFYFY